MEDFTLPSVASKNGSAVHPFFQNVGPILITPKKEKRKWKKYSNIFF
jgi:hypothetical protein